MAMHVLCRNSMGRDHMQLDDLLALLSSILPNEGALCLRLIEALRESDVTATARLDVRSHEVADVLTSFMQVESDHERENNAQFAAAKLQADQVRQKAQINEDDQEDTDGPVPETSFPLQSLAVNPEWHRRQTTRSNGLQLLSGAMLRLPNCGMQAEDWDELEPEDIGAVSPSIREAHAGANDHGSPNHKGRRRTNSLNPSEDMSSDGNEKEALPWFPSRAGGLSLRARIFILFDDNSKSRLGTWVVVLVMITLMVSTTAFLMESSPSFRERPAECYELVKKGLPLTKAACEPQPFGVFSIIEAVCVIIFTIEFLARVCTVHAVQSKHRLGPIGTTIFYAMQPLNVIDFIAILPFWMNTITEFVFQGNAEDLQFMSGLRLARIVRLFKFAKHYPGFRMFIDVLIMSGMPLAILLFFSLILSILFASILFYMEGQRFSVDPEFTGAVDGTASKFATGVYVRLDQQQEAYEITPFRSIWTALWWVYVTTTTVGYGDISPTTVPGKIVGVLCFYVGIIFMALPISVLGSNFETVYAAMINGTGKFAKDKHAGPRPRKKIVVRKTVVPTPAVTKIVPWFPREPGCLGRIFVFLDSPHASKLGNKYSLAMLFVIIGSTVSFMLESMPQFNTTPDACSPTNLTVDACRPQPDPIFFVFECVAAGIFTLDYIARALTVHAVSSAFCEALPAEPLSGWRKTVLYCTQALNVIDVLALVPFYVDLFTGGGGGASVGRVLRLVRIFRCLRMPKLRACADMFKNVMVDALPALLILLVMTTLMSILLSTCIYFAEGTNYSVDYLSESHPYGMYIRPSTDGYDIEVSPYQSIVYSSWWFFTTATTVGYGDDFPTTTAGRIVAVMTFFTGVVLLAMPVTILGGSFSKFYPDFVEEFGAMAEQQESSSLVDHVVPSCCRYSKGGGEVQSLVDSPVPTGPVTGEEVEKHGSSVQVSATKTIDKE